MTTEARAFKAVLFDLDGTLLDTLEDLGASVNRVLARAGLPVHPIDAYRYFVGEGAGMLVERSLPPERRQPAEVERFLAEYRAEYERSWAQTTRPYDGIPELLHALAERGLKLAVLSNKPDADTKNVISHFFPDVPFSVVRGQVEGVPVKPDKAGALLVAEQLSIAPADFLYLGDTKVDMTCACSAGMNPVGVLWGFRTAQELLDNGAKVLIAHPMESSGYNRLSRRSKPNPRSSPRIARGDPRKIPTRRVAPRVVESRFDGVAGWDNAARSNMDGIVGRDCERRESAVLFSDKRNRFYRPRSTSILGKP